MALKFEAKENYQLTVLKSTYSHQHGFDPKAKLQVLPKGYARGLIIRGGKGLSCSLTPADPPGCGVDQREVGNDLEVWLDGKLEGDYTLTARNGAGSKVDEVKIKVVKQRTVKVGFYEASDGKGRGIKFDDANIRPLLDRADSIVGAQTNLRLKRTGKWPLMNSQADLGDRIDLEAPGKTADFRGGWIIQDAEWHVFFVWACKDANGITKSDITVIDANLDPVKMAVTLAHEFIHFCSRPGSGHDGENADLMYKEAPHGIMIREPRQKVLVR